MGVGFAPPLIAGRQQPRLGQRGIPPRELKEVK